MEKPTKIFESDCNDYCIEAKAECENSTIEKNVSFAKIAI